MDDRTESVWLELGMVTYKWSSQNNEYLVEAALPRHKVWGLSQDETRAAEGTGPKGWWLVLHGGAMTPVH